MTDYLRRIEPLDAFLIPAPPSSAFPKSGKKPTAAQQRGLRYEYCVQRDLCERFGVSYLPAPWFSYFDGYSRQRRYCQPDGILFDLERGKVIICEIKLKHTEVAFNQISNLYFPVLQKVLGTKNWEYAACEVTRWYDYSIRVPNTYVRSSIVNSIPGQFSVYICRPRGAR